MNNLANSLINQKDLAKLASINQLPSYEEISLFKNVFVIDSSNFTNIPAGPISLTIMANALRVANESLNDK